MNDNTDCDDTDAEIHPEASEILCNDIEEDCISSNFKDGFPPPVFDGDLNRDELVTPIDVIIGFHCYIGSIRCPDYADID